MRAVSSQRLLWNWTCKCLHSRHMVCTCCSPVPTPSPPFYPPPLSIPTLFSGNSEVCHFCLLVWLIWDKVFLTSSDWLETHGNLPASAATAPVLNILEPPSQPEASNFLPFPLSLDRFWFLSVISVLCNEKFPGWGLRTALYTKGEASKRGKTNSTAFWRQMFLW